METTIDFQNTRADDDDEGYETLLNVLRVRFGITTADGARLFTTDARGLFDAFLDGLPVSRRQHYDCRACRRFVDRFGGLVTIAADGTAASVLWDPERVPAFFRRSVESIARIVARAKVDGVFLSDELIWGLPSNKDRARSCEWHHMSIAPTKAHVHKPSRVKTTTQEIAEKGQDFEILRRSLADFSIDVARPAVALLSGGSLYRSEKCLGVARWFLDLHEKREATPNARARENLVWLAAATAPAGFCHVRSSMIGTLLEDIASGMSFEQIERRFDEKMNPLIYQRPQAAPSAGNLAQAEEIVRRLASAGALARRFARLEEVEAIWRPRFVDSKPEQGGGVFGHLLPKKQNAPVIVSQPPIVMTWEKFARTVLPTAETIEFKVPTTNAGYFALVTAENKDAPPILQWDREDRRNPVSWYFYSNGSPPSTWGLVGGEFRRVTAVCMKPSMWGEDPTKNAHHGEGAFFVLDGARDLRKANGEPGAGFFPEILRSEYHGVRASMEAYARSAVISGADKASACGIGLTKGSGDWNHVFRVTSKGASTLYKLDRWD